MAVARVNTNTMGQTATGAVNTGTTFTVSAGSNLCAFAIVGYDNAAGLAITSITLGGTAMTIAGTRSTAPSSNTQYMAVYYLVAPSTGTPALVIASSGSPSDIYYNLVVFSGVNQTTPIRAGTYQNAVNQQTNASSQFSMTVTSNVADLTLTAANAASSLTSNQTSDGSNSGGTDAAASDHCTTAASSVTHIWTGGVSADIAVVGFSINGTLTTADMPLDLMHRPSWQTLMSM